MKHKFRKYLILPIAIAFVLGCEKPQIPQIPALVIADPSQYIATLTFDGKDMWDSGEKSFPLSFAFNSIQDANNDGIADIEDNLENYIPFAIGGSLAGTGRTGISNRGPNNQKPVVYFHLVRTPEYDVYQYWLYYADNDWLNDHEHDWEKYFVYVSDSIPEFIKISSHDDFKTYPWNDILKDNGHPLLGVDGGSHAMKTTAEDGVKIRYNGAVSKNNGDLNHGDGQQFPWIIYSNDIGVISTTNYSASVDTFYYGDPYYLTNNNETGDPRSGPWNMDEWTNPPQP